MSLSEQACEPCGSGSQGLDKHQQEELARQLTGWLIVDKKGVPQLLKVYKCANFVEALAFANKLGELAEAHDHHPALLVEWGKVTVRWWTHRLSGLHTNDFIMASKTDTL